MEEGEQKQVERDTERKRKNKIEKILREGFKGGEMRKKGRV